MRTLFFIVILLPLMLSACATSLANRAEHADTLAQRAGMQKYHIQAPPFILTGYGRVDGVSFSPLARLYIEGDGLAWLNRRTPSLDPTPKTPLGLELAVADPSDAPIFYLARPCQYSKMSQPNTRCDQSYWTSKRFAPEVIEAMSLAMDRLKARYHIERFELVGFSGGANVAVLLAARRGDVASIRTVAGNLDHRAHSALHHVSVLDGSLNAADVAQRVQDIPQVHFIGGNDLNVTPALYTSYSQKMGHKTCTRSISIAEANHITGWVEIWPTLLQDKPTCAVFN